jgi:hypothetical protein
VDGLLFTRARVGKISQSMWMVFFLLGQGGKKKFTKHVDGLLFTRATGKEVSQSMWMGFLSKTR